MIKLHFIKLLVNLILGFYIVLVTSFSVYSQILPGDFNTTPGVDFDRGAHSYGWCTQIALIAHDNLVYQCAYAKAYSLPSQFEIENYRNQLQSLPSSPYGLPSYRTDFQAASSPSDYLRRVCYSRIYGGFFRYIYRDGFYGVDDNGEKFNDNQVILQREDNYVFSTSLPSLPDQKWNTCKLQKSIDKKCVFDTTAIVKQSFAQKFPLDIFQSFEGNLLQSACPKIVIRGVEMELCYLVSLTKGLKYVILIMFIINSIAWL